MDQGRTIHDSNQNNLLTLLGNFGSQGDFSAHLEDGKQSVVATANTNENPITVHTLLKAGPSHSDISDSQTIPGTDSINDIPITDSDPVALSIRKSVSHNNIRKTIDEIASNQRSLISASMPQNTLLQTAVSNVPGNSNSNEFISAQSNLEMIQPGHNLYQGQEWTTGNITSGNTVGEICQSSGYNDTRQSCIPATDISTTSYPNANITSCYTTNQTQGNDFQTQQEQQYMAQDPNQLGQFLQTAQMPLQGFDPHLSQDTYTNSAPDMVSMSTYDKMDSYNQASLYSSGVQGSNPPQYSTHIPQPVPMSYGSGMQAGLAGETYHLQAHELYSDMGREDVNIGAPSNEKKLTTTPIPSDAEKMSSSSSMSSSSPGESPNPQTDPDQNVVVARHGGPKQAFPVPDQSYNPYSSENLAPQSLNQKDRTMLNQVPTNPTLNTGMLYVNENVQNQIPVPENVIEITEPSIDYHVVEPAPTQEGIPVSPPNSTSHNQLYTSNNASSMKPCSAKTDANNGTTMSIDSNSSWSVVREERRKQKLEKKMQQTESRSNTGTIEKVDSQTRKHSKHKHKRSKHHQVMPPNVITMPVVSNGSSGTYSGMIPKVTADPTSNMKLNHKPAGPPRSITEKVKQQMMKDKLKAPTSLASKRVPGQNVTPREYAQMPHTVNANTTSATPLPSTSDALIQPNSYSHIAPSKFATLNKDAPVTSTTCRWQTVTAIEGPKMPPMLSERDRIPKRGRPSKKMTEMNLKFKPKGSETKVVPVPAVSDKPNVAMYTINESGRIEKLENKPKQNQRSKERAEAFQNELREISKKTSIQMKTAGAKEVVGAFKANCVRTRTQANNTTESEDGKKKVKTKNKVFGGDTSTSKQGLDKVMDENGVYTFSELAKQFKISNSILFRAIEQSHRSSMSRKHSKSSQKNKEKTAESLITKPVSNPIPETPIEVKETPTSIVTSIEKKVDETLNKERANELPEIVPHEECISPIKPTSLSSEKSADISGEIVKRKKKKKKHKKDKNESGKKKKNKDKKKKSKRKEKALSNSLYSLEPNNEVFSNSATDFVPPEHTSQPLSPPQAALHPPPLDTQQQLQQLSSPQQQPLEVPEPKKKNLDKKQEKIAKSDDVAKLSTSKHDVPTTPSKTPLKKIASHSSLSACEDTYDVSDSFSDTEPTPPISQPKLYLPSPVSSSSTTSTLSPTTVSTVFGSGISTLMPTFQGIKEHGGLQQFSDHSKSLAEANLFRGKKHKHKKKKPVNRAKNVTDPEFLSKMEKLAESLVKLRLSSNIAMPLFGTKTSNVFAKTFSSSNVYDQQKTDSLSYRDPNAARSKQKQKKVDQSGYSLQDDTRSVSSEMSVFCRSVFFQNHGLIKPYEKPTGTNLMKSSVNHDSMTTPKKKFEFANSSDKSSMFSKTTSNNASPFEATELTSRKSSKEFPKDLFSEPPKQTASDSSPVKPTKRKRGWPKGKPRGLRSKLPQNPLNDLSSEKEVFRNKTKALRKVSLSDASPASCASKKAPKEKKVEEAKSTPKPDKVNEKLKHLEESSSASVKVTTSPVSTPINQDLVNHIKAVITASLSSSVVCSDTVAKTVDNAVASYMQNMETLPDFSKTAPLSASKTEKGRKGRPREKPCKYPKAFDKACDVSDASKVSEKHPKKLWASKHQGVAEESNITAPQPQKQKRGRPRKYPSLDGEPSAKLHKKSSTKTSKSRELATTKRLSESYITKKTSKSLKTISRNEKTTSGTTIIPGSKQNSIAIKKKIIPITENEEYSKEDDSALKGGFKKSLESVVAKLKRKQSSTSSLSGSESPVESQSPTFQDDAISAEPLDELPQHLLTSSRKRRIPAELDESDKPTRKEKITSEPLRKKQCTNERRKSFPVEKKWLKAGLYSPEYKQNSNNLEETGDESRTEVLFPPPIHAGLVLREKSTNFRLPHDVWSLYNRKQISYNQKIETEYIKIEENVYYDVAPTSDKFHTTCDCSAKTSNENCLSKCKNRLSKIECSPDNCLNGARCSNDLILRRKVWSNVEKFETSQKGWGLKTTADISEDQFLLEFVGEVVSDTEFTKRWIENYSAQTNHYSVQLEPGKIIDAYRCGNDTRFVNHSCQPNCEMQKWYSGGKYHLCLFSNQPIKSGEELTFDYSTCANDMLEQSQVCKCKSSKCRGKIVGIKLQTTDCAASHPTKPIQSITSKKRKVAQDLEEPGRLQYTTVYESHMQPTSAEETMFIKAHKPFLLRNLTKIKRQHELMNKQGMDQVGGIETDTSGNLDKTDKHRLLYDVIKDIFDRIMGCKDEDGVSVAIPFINLRSKQSGPDHKKDPFDLSFVEDKIVAKQYEKFDEFSSDLLHAFRNAEKQFGRKSAYGKDVARLRRVYGTSRNAALAVLGETREKSKNKVWQHCDCMQVKPGDYTDGVEYLCEECDDREVPQEVEVVPQPPSAPPGHTYYLTLLKDNLLIRQGDCVRLIHDHCLRQRQSNNPPIRSSYRLQSHSAPERMDFFRIEKLWTDDNGDKFAYGYHFARPQDTKHTETRVFFTNELLATPYHEIVPLDAVVSRCCVMDLETYRRGKPKEFKEQDIYICQHRTDLSLRIINRVIKNRYPICTKSHVFETYPVRLVTVRNFKVPEQYRKSQSRRTQWLRSLDTVTKSEDECSSSDDDDDDGMINEQASTTVAMETGCVESDDERALSDERNFKEKRLNGILKKLMKDATSRK